jgi:hypothetical protein
MYREDTEFGSKFYEYVGLASIDELVDSNHHWDLQTYRDRALEFRERSLKYYPSGYELQLLEQMVSSLMPYASIYHTIKEKELFVAHYALRGIHYFRQI